MKRVLADNDGIVEIRRRSKFLKIFAGALLLSAGLFTPNGATASVYTLLPGATIAASPSTFPVGGTVLSTFTGSFSSSTIDGTVTSTVIRGDSSNPYGGLTFEYLLTMTGGSDNISEMTSGGYAGYQTDVSFNPSTPTAGIPPSFFSRSSAGVNNGDTLEYSWILNKLSPGQSGDLVVVQTSANNFGFSQGGVIDSLTANVTLLTPVPEPQIASLAAMGLGALFIFLRRKSK